MRPNASVSSTASVEVLRYPELRGRPVLAFAGIAAPEEGSPGLYRYRPHTDELGARLDALAEAYAGSLLAVTELIHSRLDKRAHQFADAFRLRKDS